MGRRITEGDFDAFAYLVGQTGRGAGGGDFDMVSYLMGRKAGGGGEAYTVTGISPLLLENALAKRITRLVQTGKVEQATTPTPDAPVDIVCNNGAIKFRRPSGMPTRYQMVEWLKSNANITITGFQTKNTYEIECRFYREEKAAQYLYASDSGSSLTTNTTAYLSSSGGNWRFGTVARSFNPDDLVWIVSVQNKDGVWLNGTKTASYTGVSAFTSVEPLKLLSAITTDPVTRISYLKVRENDALLLDLIPVKDMVANTYGFYDRVGEAFYTNPTGDYISGAEISDPIEMYIDGTPEVLTVGEQTASVVNLFAVGDYADTVDIISGELKRNVGVRVFNGTENDWALSDSGTTHRFRGTKPRNCYTPASRAPIASTHFKYLSSGSATGGAFIGASTYWYFIPTDQTIDSINKWKAWLAAQYAAGTPIIVIYPLAESTTEQVEAQTLSTVQGDNTVAWTAEVSGTTKEIIYTKAKNAAAIVGTAVVGTAKVS